MDIIGSDPRPPTRWQRRARVGVRRLAARRRPVVVAAALLAVAGAAILATTNAGLQRPGTLWSADLPVRYGAQDLIPLDQLPGRTPIPAPAVVGYDKQTVIGRLPVGGSPGQATATAVTELVLGRYCQTPTTYDIRVSPEAGWAQVTARAFRIDRGGYALSVGLRLVWIRSAYAWTGRLTELGFC